jgi:pheromone shutdown-related protein TraB
MPHIIVIGTSHIARESIEDIQRAVEQHQPQFVAVELDVKRLHALLSKKKRGLRLVDIRRVGFKGFVFAAIGGFLQRKLGKMVGSAPGSDMLEAVKIAREKKCTLALIDQDIEVTLRRFSQSLSWRERFRFVGDLVRGLLFPKRELKRVGLDHIDLSKVPPDVLVRKLTLQLKKRYPSVYQVLIKERNDVMIGNIRKIVEAHPEATVVVVVGAGHKEAIERAF